MKDKLTIEELAEHYRISRVTVNSWKKRGCPYFRVPSPNTLKYRIYFSIAEVEKWRKSEQKKRGE